MANHTEDKRLNAVGRLLMDHDRAVVAMLELRDQHGDAAMLEARRVATETVMSNEDAVEHVRSKIAQGHVYE